MNLLKSFQTFYAGGLAAINQKSSNPFTSQGWGGNSMAGSSSFRNDKEELHAYEKIVWVAVCIDAICRDAIRPFKFCNVDGEEIETHRIDPRIVTPVELGFYKDSFGQVLSRALAHRLLTGNGILLPQQGTAHGANRGMDDTFFPVMPSRVRPIVSSSGWVLDGYEVRTKDGRMFRVAPEDVIHFSQNKIFDNHFWGVGNITKARLIAEGETESDQYANEFMRRRAQPSMVITDDAERSSDEIERIQNLVADKMQGKQNAGSAYFMSGKNVKVTAFQLSQKDMQFMEQKAFNRQAILSVNGVPPVVAGIPDGANKAVAMTQRLGYLANTINPIIKELEDDLNFQWVHKFDKNVYIKFQRHLTGDVENIKKMVESGLITPNRGSELIGEQCDLDNEARNRVYLPAGLLALDDDVSVAANEPTEPRKSVDIDLMDPHNVDAIVEAFTNGTKSRTRPKRHQIAYLRTSLESRNKVEKIYTSKLATYFREQEKRILEALEKNYTGKSVKTPDISVNIIFSLLDESLIFDKLLKGMHTSGIQRAVGDINKLTVTNAATSSSIGNPNVSAAIGELGHMVGGRKAAKIQETTRAALEKVVLTSIEADADIVAIQTEIQRKFSQFQGSRARLIARTESRVAWDKGAEIAYKEIGVQTVDVVGCTMFEPDSDCGRQGIPVGQISSLVFHPNHIGSLAPSEEI